MGKLCSCCSHPAEYSLVSILSSVGLAPRLQKCSDAVLFCATCLQKLLEGKHLCFEQLIKAVNRAYTELNRRSETRSEAVSMNEASDLNRKYSLHTRENE
jgi:hypothetical protein